MSLVISTLKRPTQLTRGFGFSLALLLSLSGISAANPPYKNLPKATFNSYSQQPGGGGGSSLPMSTGLHLSPGLDRRRNAPVERYEPGEPKLNMQLVRWEQKKMPLLIWISPGLQLPGCSFEQLQSIRVDQVTDMLRSPSNPLASLPQAKSWNPAVNDQVAAGIEQWREFQNEGLFSFAFTDDPHNANVVVFFVDAFEQSDTPGGIMVGGNTSAQVYPVAQAQQMKIAQKPVVIELSLLVDNTDQKVQGAAAHEFGHALGIKAHSPYREDIMYSDRVVDHLSPADKATIRYLYRAKPQWVM
jgi:predicted Zn-dependent protease